MTSTSNQTNVYDERGTVLYRAIPYSAPPEDGNTKESNAVPCAFNISVAGNSLGSTATSRIRPKGLCVPNTAVTMASNLDFGANSAVSIGTAVPQEVKKLVHDGDAPENALAKLFPPEPLPSSQTHPHHLVDSVTLQEPQPMWVKVAAIDHTGRLDSVNLRDHLERRCRDENARPSGVVCSIREGIYTDGLKEVIRQITVLCPERGLLLAELAGEMQQTTNTYDILFDSACQYAVRKGIERDMRSYLNVEKERLESEVRRLENRVNELREKHDGMVKRFEEQKQAEQNLHEEEVKYLKKANQQIVNEIKRIAALEIANAAAQSSIQHLA